MARVNALDWLRNEAGRIWVEALDGPRPDAEPSLDQLIEQSAQELGAAAPGQQPAAATPPAEQQPAAMPPAQQRAPAPAPQGILPYLPAIALVLLVVLVGLLLPGGEEMPASLPTPLPPTTVPTAAAVVAPTVATESVSRAVVGFFDYHNPETFTGLTAGNMVRVIGKAGDGWRLVLLGDGAKVWVRTVDVPADLPSDSPLTDLTLKADPPVAVAPPVVEQPAAAPPLAAPPAAAPAAAAPPPAARVSGEIELSRAPATAELPAPAAAADAETASFRVGGCGPDGSSKCPRTLPRVRER